jgi:hypothetical protein
MFRKTIVLCVFVTATQNYAYGKEQTSNVVNITANPALCGELLASADNHATQERALGVKAAEQVSGGEGELKDESCFSGIMDFDVDFFKDIPSWHSISIKAIKDQALEKLREFTCDAAESVNNALDELTQCSISVGLNASAGIDDLNIPSVEQCGGVTTNYQFDASDGASNPIFEQSTGGSANTSSTGSARGIINDYF